MTKLIPLLAFLLTACSFGGLAKQPQTAEGGESLSGHILLWHSRPRETIQAIRDASEQFNRLYPETEIISEYVPSNELSERFLAEAQAGLGPDLVMEDYSEIPQLVAAEVLQNLTPEQINLANHRPAAREQVRYRGKIYGFPLALHTQVLCYNQEKVSFQPRLKSAPSEEKPDGSREAQSPSPPPQQPATDRDGISFTQPPKTLQGLLDRALAGYSVGLVSSFLDTFWGMRLFEVKLLEDRHQISFAVNTDGWARWLAWLREANNQPNFILNPKREVLQEAFIQGRLAYYVCQTGEILALREALRDKLGIALLPENKGKVASPLFSTQVLLFNRASSPQQTELALKFAHFLTNVEQQTNYALTLRNFIPSNQKVQVDRRLYPRLGILMEQSKSAVGVSADNIEQASKVGARGDVLYQQVLSGEIEPREAASQLARVVRQEFQLK